jgi:hypothetical protein
MRSHYAKLIRVALLSGIVCFLVHWGLSVVGWWLFPDQPGDDELIRQMRWAGHTVGEKILGLALLSITAFLASRAHRPTWRLGVATGIAAAVAYQLIAVLVYFVRFGVSAYQEYHDFIWTMLWTAGLAWLFGYLAVRRQYLHEKHAA